MNRSLLGLAAAVLLMVWAPAALAASPHPRASFTDIENDLMCTLCHESLAVANSPEADSERSEIRRLIAQGETKQQIEQNMVAQYGLGVLGRPPASGFNLTVYVLPPAILAGGIVILVIVLPRWRRRTRAAKGRSPEPVTPAFDPAEAVRLDQELSQFRG